MGKSQAVPFLSLASVKRYANRRGKTLARTQERPGSKPKLDERSRRLLEADLEDRFLFSLCSRGWTSMRGRWHLPISAAPDGVRSHKADELDQEKDDM